MCFSIFLIFSYFILLLHSSIVFFSRLVDLLVRLVKLVFWGVMCCAMMFGVKRNE